MSSLHTNLPSNVACTANNLEAVAAKETGTMITIRKAVHSWSFTPALCSSMSLYDQTSIVPNWACRVSSEFKTLPLFCSSCWNHSNRSAGRMASKLWIGPRIAPYVCYTPFPWESNTYRSLTNGINAWPVGQPAPSPLSPPQLHLAGTMTRARIGDQHLGCGRSSCRPRLLPDIILSELYIYISTAGRVRALENQSRVRPGQETPDGTLSNVGWRPAHSRGGKKYDTLRQRPNTNV